ncbi:MAG: hypothetical protein FD126_2616, partial [Elusimicrobia bacterium]
RLGTPVIAILLKPGARFESSRAHFSALKNQAGEPLYQRLEKPLKAAILSELLSGEFQMELGDEEGHRTAANPDPDKIRLKIDFAARLKLAGFEDPLVLVDGAEYSRSARRCLRLVDGDKVVGPCVEMPHELMAETAALDFVAYDPSRSGKPFVLAFTCATPSTRAAATHFKRSTATRAPSPAAMAIKMRSNQESRPSLPPRDRASLRRPNQPSEVNFAPPR